MSSSLWIATRRVATRERGRLRARAIDERVVSLLPEVPSRFRFDWRSLDARAAVERESRPSCGRGRAETFDGRPRARSDARGVKAREKDVDANGRRPRAFARRDARRARATRRASEFDEETGSGNAHDDALDDAHDDARGLGDERTARFE